VCFCSLTNSANLPVVEKEIDWERLRELLKLAQKAKTRYDPSKDDADDDKAMVSRQTIDLFFRFMTSRAGLFLKKPLVHELAEAIDGMASIGEANLFRATSGLLPKLPGMNGPVNDRVMREMRMMLDTFQDAVAVNETTGGNVGARMEALRELLDELSTLLADERLRKDAGPLLDEVRSVIQMVALEVLEIRGSRAMRSILSLAPA
jgi:hypothetical protein